VRKVFADTLYWIATVKRNESYHAAAKQARDAVTGPSWGSKTEKQ
jgi:hypothetical protein